jgi:hypothetical protein
MREEVEVSIRVHFNPRRTGRFCLLCRRRLGPPTRLQVGTHASCFNSLSPLNNAHALSLIAFHLSPAALSSVRRSRLFAQQDDATAQKLQELMAMVEQQAAEIQRLKSEKESVEASVSQLSSHQAKVEHENKILKRAVAIQQERQNQMNAELEGARQFKSAVEERVRRLEQMNLTLQYRLQATMASENDFMWSSPRPPDVY